MLRDFKACCSFQPYLLNVLYAMFYIYRAIQKLFPHEFPPVHLNVLVGQMGDVVPPACPGSPLGSPPSQVKLVCLRGNASGTTSLNRIKRHPSK